VPVPSLDKGEDFNLGYFLCGCAGSDSVKSSRLKPGELPIFGLFYVENDVLTLSDLLSLR